MSKWRTVIASVMQFLVIAAILLLILGGLARIGLVETPPFLARLFGAPAEDAAPAESAGPSFLKNGEAGETATTLTLTPETVETLISASPRAEHFGADVRTTLHTTAGDVEGRYLVRADGENMTACRVEDNAVTRLVLSDGDTLSVNELRGGKMRTVTYRAGDVTLENEIGVILSPDAFLSRADDPAYTFRLLAEDGKAVLLVTFDAVIGAYRQTQRYKIDLDFGVVTEAVCTENGETVYEMHMTALGETLDADVQIADEYRALLDGASEE